VGKQRASNSRRKLRRRARAAARTSQQTDLCPLFGANTDILIGLSGGIFRRVNLMLRFSDSHVAHLDSTDAAGLTTSWRLPNRRGSRGFAVALNPSFPLVQEAHALLCQMAKTYRIRILSDATDAERELVQSRTTYNLDLMFGSRVRTKTLAALECLNGRARWSELVYSVPDVHPGSVKRVLNDCVRNGILAKVKSGIAFANVPWRPELRSLLRAYARTNTGFLDCVKDLAKSKKHRTSSHRTYALFGKPASERLLSALAQKGPMTPGRLIQQTQIHLNAYSIRKFVGMGIIARESSMKGGRLALNAKHPIFAPLRDYLLLATGLDPRAVLAETFAGPGPFSVKELFGTELRLDVLMMIFLAEDEGMNGLDLLRLLPQHDRRTMMQKIWQFTEKGIVLEDDMAGGIIRYRLNPDFKLYQALCTLLGAIVLAWPRFEKTYDCRRELWPDGRLARERKFGRA
jgi:hypothetical protein